MVVVVPPFPPLAVSPVHDHAVDHTLEDGLDQLEGDAEPVGRHEALDLVKEKRGDLLFSEATSLEELICLTLDEILERSNRGDLAAESLGKKHVILVVRACLDSWALEGAHTCATT